MQRGRRGRSIRRRPDMYRWQGLPVSVTQGAWRSGPGQGRRACPVPSGPANPATHPQEVQPPPPDHRGQQLGLGWAAAARQHGGHPRLKGQQHGEPVVQAAPALHHRGAAAAGGGPTHDAQQLWRGAGCCPDAATAVLQERGAALHCRVTLVMALRLRLQLCVGAVRRAHSQAAGCRRVGGQLQQVTKAGRLHRALHQVVQQGGIHTAAQRALHICQDELLAGRFCKVSGFAWEHGICLSADAPDSTSTMAHEVRNGRMLRAVERLWVIPQQHTVAQSARLLPQQWAAQLPVTNWCRWPTECFSTLRRGILPARCCLMMSTARCACFKNWRQSRLLPCCWPGELLHCCAAWCSGIALWEGWHASAVQPPTVAALATSSVAELASELLFTMRPRRTGRDPWLCAKSSPSLAVQGTVDAACHSGPPATVAALRVRADAHAHALGIMTTDWSGAGRGMTSWHGVMPTSCRERSACTRRS